LNKQPCNTGRLGKIRVLAVVLLTVVIGMAPVPPVQGSIPYLPSTGPAPLRFELAATPGFAWAWKQLRVAEIASAAARGAGTADKATNAVAPTTVSSAITNIVTGASVKLAGPVATKKPELLPDNVTLPDPSDEVADPVSPQALAEFFKPGAGGKTPNGTAATRPGQIGFSPPAPKAAPESRAVYKSQ
jgi:hypothetical protein